MNEIYEVTGHELRSLLLTLGVPDDETSRIYSLKACVDGGLKVKLNNGMWTPPLGVKSS